MRKRRRQGGFSLIELTLVIGVSVMLASAVVGMFNLNLQMMNQAVKYQFLAKDAPFIGLLLTKTIGNAEDSRIFANRTNAVTGTPAVLTGPAVRLWMRQPNSTFRQAILSFEPINNHQGIYFFLADDLTGVFPATPSWGLAGCQLKRATFDASTG